MYSLQTSLIIVGMVLTGTARSVGVKVFYQLGCDNPLFIALLYLVGQSMALIVYGFSRWCQTKVEEKYEYEPVHVKEVLQTDDSDSDSGCTSLEDDSSDELSQLEAQPPLSTHDTNDTTVSVQPSHPHSLDRCESAPIIPISTNTTCTKPLHHSQSLPVVVARPTLVRRGSKTGLTQESQDAVAWVHVIPWQVKPLIPGLFNLANAALKWASFVFVAASIAEMLMSGLELVLSVMVARLVRKRQINSMRWTGVMVVAIGLATVHAADLWDSSNDSENAISNRRQHLIGAVLIVGQCVTAVGQDMAEELFLQETNFPATLLLGLEGVYGLLFGIPLYLRFAPEAPHDTLANLLEEDWKIGYLVFLTLVFTVTGIFNILTTGVTSSMTRNMWKNCRTLCVWVVGLALFYGGGNRTLGEEWVVPDSFFILGGFLIMLSGIYVYYSNK